MKSKYPAKLTGAINWVRYDNDSGSVDVKRALLRSANEIIIDCESEAAHTQSSSSEVETTGSKASS